MNVLLDTCVLFELRRPKPDVRVSAAVDQIADENLLTSVMSIGEIAKGVDLLPNGRKKSDLTQWLVGLEQQFADHILPADHATARIWGTLSARAQAQGAPLPVVDGLVASTAWLTACTS